VVNGAIRPWNDQSSGSGG